MDPSHPGDAKEEHRRSRGGFSDTAPEQGATNAVGWDIEKVLVGESQA